MEELAAAAAAADDAADATVAGAESAEQPSGGTSGKKKQATAVEVGQRNLAAAQASLEIAQAKVDGVAAKGTLATAAEKKVAARASNNLPVLREKVRAAEDELRKRQEKEGGGRRGCDGCQASGGSCSRGDHARHVRLRPAHDGGEEA